MNISLIIQLSTVINSTCLQLLSQESQKIRMIFLTQLSIDSNIRFKYYGIHKTAMADIAEDVGMSTANLYRYFKNKEDIAVACSIRCLRDRTSHLEAIVVNSKNKADEKIRLFFSTILQYTYDQVQNSSKINELVTVIAEKHPNVVREKNNADRLLIERIIKQGIEEHIFEATNLKHATIGVHTALNIFQLPLAMSIYDIDTLSSMARHTVELILNGLQKTGSNVS